MEKPVSLAPLPIVTVPAVVVTVPEMNFAHFEPAPRHDDLFTSGVVATAGFAEVNHGLAVPDALDEAGRCFNCGVCNSCELCLIFCPDRAISFREDGRGYQIDLSYCKGCGVCSAECPRGAITMTREGL
jgi:2-oxoacid:acceptor oxidoreductase delta subunit (pyruvate/2-ketoisovalerate family)